MYISELLKEPKTWRDLLSHPKKLKFIIKYNKKITNLTKINTFSIINMPLNFFYKHLLLMIWVFKYKTDSEDFIIKYKARLVAKEDR